MTDPKPTKPTTAPAPRTPADILRAVRAMIEQTDALTLRIERATSKTRQEENDASS